MDEAAPMASPRHFRRWHKVLKLPLVLFIPLYLVVVLPLFLLFGLYSILHVWISGSRQNRRLRRTMTAANRIASWDEVARDAASGPGTIVCDNRSLGWNVVSVWWMPGVRVSVEGPPAPTDKERFGGNPPEPIFDRWLMARCTDPMTGVGRLICCTTSYRGRRRIERRCETLRAQCPQLEVQTLYSGLDSLADDAPRSAKPASATKDSSG